MDLVGHLVMIKFMDCIKEHMKIYNIIYFPLVMIYDYSKELEVIQVDMTFHGVI